jgi:predicted transcriptional regulator
LTLPGLEPEPPPPNTRTHVAKKEARKKVKKQWRKKSMDKFKALKSGTFAMLGKKSTGVMKKMPTTNKKRIITKKDLEILETINRFGYMTVKEIAKISGRQEKRIYTRLKTLCDYGLLNYQTLFYGTPRTYWLTYDGKITCDSPLTPIKGLKAATYMHGLKVVGVYIKLKEQYGEGMTWITDREIMSSRVTSAQTFKAAFQALKAKIPDGVIVYENKKFAVEVELSLKGSSRMKKIIGDYVKALSDGVFQAVLYYTDSQRVQKRLEETIMAVAGTSANRFRILEID